MLSSLQNAKLECMRAEHTERETHAQTHAWRQVRTDRRTQPHTLPLVRVHSLSLSLSLSLSYRKPWQLTSAAATPMHCRVLLLVSPRDMCMALTIKEVVPGKAWITCSTSMLHEKCPPIKGNVRGVAEVAGTYGQPVLRGPGGATPALYLKRDSIFFPWCLLLPFLLSFFPSTD